MDACFVKEERKASKDLPADQVSQKYTELGCFESLFNFIRTGKYDYINTCFGQN